MLGAILAHIPSYPNACLLVIFLTPSLTVFFMSVALQLCFVHTGSMSMRRNNIIAIIMPIRGY